jgi:hypothetical protein
MLFVLALKEKIPSIAGNFMVNCIYVSYVIGVTYLRDFSAVKLEREKNCARHNLKPLYIALAKAFRK